VWSTQIFGDPNVLSPKSYSSRNPHVRSRMVYLAEFINKSVPLKGRRVCDIGAGEGQFLEIIQPMGAEAFGIEPSPANCKFLEKSGFPYFHGTVEQYAQSTKASDPSRGFDVVTMMFTVECTQKPLVMMQVANDILKPDGHIAVHTGSRILVPFKKPLHNFLSHSPVDTHPVHLSFNTLKGLLATAGFQVSQFNPYVENDNLCVLARKMPKGTKIEWQGDDFLKVADYFERWHKESLHYR
jgi:2-polyprenyl-3-methyl-5-hydroxy-6-metoxy-1,4-benzoquinol methylase